MTSSSPPTPDVVVAAFNANVRAELARRGLTRPALGRLLCIEGTTVSARLGGRRPWPLEDAALVAHWLGVPLGRLIEPAPAMPAEEVPPPPQPGPDLLDELAAPQAS